MSTGSVSGSSTTGTTRQRMPGLASGFDTTSMVESLMALERKPLEKMEIKKQTEQVKLQAYQAVNSLLLKFRTSVSNLASKKLWNAKTAVSSNEKSLTATANEYAVKGSYSFRVAKLATATQYMSKGFADSKAPLVPQKEGEDAYKIGEINLNSSKTRVDNSAKVDDLNGCKGIFRGSVRITDSNNNTSVIDLSACDTMEEVVRELNASDKALIKASIKDGAIQIEDTSRGGGTLRVQNVGTGTTATDLGIAGETEVGETVLKGYNVYTLGDDMSLSMLNDGLGVEEGKFLFRVSNNDGFVTMEVDVDGCKTVGDIVKRVNDTITEKASSDDIDKDGGLKYKDLLAGVRFGYSEDKTSFSLTGVTAGNSYQFWQDEYSDAVFKTEPAVQLGLNGRKKVATGETEVTFDKVLGSVDSPMLKTLGGVDGQKIGEAEKVYVAFNADTKLKNLNSGTGLDLSRPLQFLLTEGGDSGSGLDSVGNIKNFNDILDHDILQDIYDGENGYTGTVGELVTFINESIDKYARDPSKNAAGLIGTRVELDPVENRLNIAGIQGGYKLECIGSMASGLGLTRYTVEVPGADGYLIKSSVDGYKDNKDAIDYFYNLGSDFKSLLADGVVEMNLDPDKVDSDGDPVPVSTLKDLVGLHGVTRQSGESDADYTTRVNTALNTLFSDPMVIKSREKIALSTGDLPYERQVSINWGNIVVLDDDGNAVKDPNDPTRDMTFADMDMSDIDVNTFMKSVNAAIQKGMDDDVPNLKQRMKDVIDASPDIPPADQVTLKAEIDALDDAKLTTSAPQIDAHHLGTGFRWTNANFSAEWDISGDAMKALQLDKNTWQYIDDGTGTFVDNDHYMKPLATSGISFDAKPMETGYYKLEDVTGTTKLNELNYGVGLTLAGTSDEDTIDFLFDTIKVTEDGKEVTKDVGVSISLKEIKEALLDDANNNLGYDTTVEDYAKILNQLLQDKLDTYNTANNSSFEMEIGFDDDNDRLILENLKNVEQFTITGAAANSIATGIESYYVDKEQMGKLDADHKFLLGELTTATVHQTNVTGLGDITFSVGNSTDLFTLKTGGTMKYADGTDVLDSNGDPIEIKVDEFSSLNELLDVLNQQMQYLADDTKGGNAALKSVRFALNSSGTGIAVDNGSASRITFKDTVEDLVDPVTGDPTTYTDANRLGQALGLVNQDNSDRVVESRSFSSCDSIGRNYISRATSLEDFLGKNADVGSMNITNAYGNSFTISMTGFKTIGDVIDAINAGTVEQGLFVTASINAAGNGITLSEYYPSTPFPAPTGNISVSDTEGGSTAKKLGMAGEGKRSEETGGASVIDGTLGVKMEVMSSDSLESIMYRLAESGNYKCAIINDGKSSNPYRLTVASANTGEANDFVLDGDLLDLLGFSQTSRASDGKVLYGDPNSAASPVMLSSSTNTNSTAILGLTLDLKATSSEWTTLTIDDDKERVSEEITGMVESYNELSEIIRYLAADDEETGEPGIFAGDTTIRSLMDDINEFFYQVYNPNNVPIGTPDADGKQQTWTWMDLGVSLTAANTSTDGSGSWYQMMELDQDALDDMIANNWDVLSKMLSNETNVSNVNQSENVKPTASFNGELEDTFSANGAINGDISSGGWGSANGLQAKGTIADGSNEYTIWFQKPVTMSRMSIYHQSSATALKDFTVEYLDEQGKWQTFREINGNTTDANHLGVALPTTMQAIRIKASSTNAEDGKFRLLDVQVYEQGGLAGKLNYHTTELGDTQTGFLATQTTDINSLISELDEQMANLQSRLESKEEALWRKFSNMEKVLGELDNQKSYLTTMMDSMSAK